MTPVSGEDAEDLVQLIASYGQDFGYEFDGDERMAFDEFAEQPGRDLRPAALRDLDRLLETAGTEAELERRLRRLGLAYVVQVGGSATYRDFLLRLRGWLVESLEQRPPDSVQDRER